MTFCRPHLEKAAGVLRILSVPSRRPIDVEEWETENLGPLSSNMTGVEPLTEFVPQLPHLRNRRWWEGQDRVEGLESQQTECIRILVLPLSTCVSEPQFHHLENEKS